MSWVFLFFRIVLAAVFLYAGIVKAGASEEFALALLPYTFVPPGWNTPIAIVLPWVEILAGILILLPRVHRLGSLLIMVLCVVFIGVIAWALSRDIVVSCSCFGEDEAPSQGKMVWAIARDGILFLLAAATLFLPGRK